MWAVRNESCYTYYYNKKENAIKKAKEIYNEFIKENYNTIENYCEDNGDFTYNDVMKEIETGNFYDDFIDIFEIETED